MASTLSFTQRPGQAPHAPLWHTALFVGFLLAVAITGTLLGLAPSQRPAAPPSPWVPLAVQGMMLVYVTCAFRPRCALLPLLGRGWDSFGRAATDVAIASLGLFAIVALENALSRPAANHGVSVPIMVALAVGFGEEVVYRGYLQTQLVAFTGRPIFAIGAQAVLFGIAHGDRGLAAVMRITLYGVLFGLVAHWRKSLVPGILAHVSLDVLAGA